MNVIIPAALSLCLLGVSAASAQTEAPAGPVPAAPPPLESVPPSDESQVDPVEQAATVTSDEQFANSAAMHALLFGLAAKQAQAQSQDAGVVAFASEAEARNSTLIEQLRAAASAGPVAIPVPFGLDMTHRQKLDALSAEGATGAEGSFETRFAALARELSAVSAALYASYAERGESESLTGFARTALPEIEAQESEVEALAAALGL